MIPFDRTLVDPSVTDEEIERAHDGEPAPFPQVEIQDALDHELDARGIVSVVPASRPQRIVNARQLRTDHVFVGVGMCLRTVRGPILNVPAVFPTAAAAGDRSAPFHAITDPGSIEVPRAAIGFAWNGGAGHTWLELGGGLVSTTDFHENGYEGVALRSRMLAWCGATRWGWGESVNGVDVWPDPRKPARPPWSWQDRLTQLHHDLHDARCNGAGQRHLDGLERWIAQIEARHSGKAHGGS